jgi:predicted tellurium resistance membrane protein TerC
MEAVAFVTGLIQIGVIWAAWTMVLNPVQRRVIVTIAALSLALCVGGLLMLVLRIDGPTATTAAVWALYVAGGLAMLWALAAVLRQGPHRFTWRQRRYARYARDYRNYRRI